MMLQRVLEPEVMDSVAEASDYDAMDHAQVNALFVTHLLEQRADFSTVLDVGTGTAQIPLELCARHARVEIIAIDLAAEMLRVGQRNVENAGFRDRIRLQLCDAKKMPFADASFDAVISNSIIHHIPEPFAVLGQMARVVKPGGSIFVRDLLRPNDLTQLQGFVERYANGASAHQKQMFADSLHAALTLEEIRALTTRLGFAPSTVQQTSDRHWTWSATRPAI